MPPISNPNSIKNNSQNMSKDIDFDKESGNEGMIKTNEKDNNE